MSEMTIFNFKTETGVYNWCIHQAMTGNVEIWIVRVTTTQKHEKILMVVSDSWYEIDWQPGTEGPISNSDVFIASRAHIAHETLTTTKTESIKRFWKKSIKFIGIYKMDRREISKLRSFWCSSTKPGKCLFLVTQTTIFLSFDFERQFLALVYFILFFQFLNWVGHAALNSMHNYW